MATASDFAEEIVMIHVVECVDTWVMPTEDEEPLTLELNDLEPILDDDENEDAILQDIIWLFDEHDTVAECKIEEGSGDAAAAVPALGSPDVLQQAGDSVQAQHEKADTIPSVEEERDTITLKWKTEPETTTAAVPSKTRSRAQSACCCVVVARELETGSVVLPSPR